jgi:glycosyltransferase involved in cell wall biosynthesis
MKIAVDTRQIGNNYLDGYGYFLYEVLGRITHKNPGHEFIFVFDRAYNTKFLFGKNVSTIVTGPRASNPIFRRLWYDVKLPALLKKHKIDVFIAGNGICSLTTKTPQCILINDLSFLYSHSFIKKADLFFLKRYTKKFLQRANSIVTTSEHLRKDILSRYAIEDKKVTIVPGAVKDVFYHLDASRKEEVKWKYAGGKNYFIYAGIIHPGKNIINLLKAFSVFKKRQKSDWKLVLAGDLTPGYKNFSENLKTYKYRKDVILTGYVEDVEMVKLTAAAYAFIYPSFYEGSGMQLLGPLSCHIPVITSINSAMQEMAGDAALYVDPGDYNDIAGKMMLLYKDESLRNSLIEKGKIVAAQYSSEKTADLFWQSILKAIK